MNINNLNNLYQLSYELNSPNSPNYATMPGLRNPIQKGLIPFAKTLEQKIQNIYPLEERPTEIGVIIRRKNGNGARLITKNEHLLHIGNCLGKGQTKEVREFTDGEESSNSIANHFVYAELSPSIPKPKTELGRLQFYNECHVGAIISSAIDKALKQQKPLSPELYHGAKCLVRVFEGNSDPENAKPFVLMERVNGKDLETYKSELKSNPTLDKQMISIAYDVFCAIAFLHSIGIIHKDIKSDNIFIDEEHGARLGDFGVSSTWEDDVLSSNSLAGSAIYMSPEYLDQRTRNSWKMMYSTSIFMGKEKTDANLALIKKFAEKRDVWAAAMTFLLIRFDEISPNWKKEKYKGTIDFFSCLTNMTNEKIMKWGKYEPHTDNKRTFSSEPDEQFVEILLKGLDVKVNTRPTAIEMAKNLKALLHNQG